MNNQTIHQVDPIELRKKLAKLGIGPKFQFSQAACEDAVRDFLNQHSQEAQVVASDIEDAVGTVSDIASIEPGVCVLEPAEIAYMIRAWAMLWDLP